MTCTFLLAVGNHQLAERTRQELEQLDSQIEYHRFMAQKRYNNNPPRWPPPSLTLPPDNTHTFIVRGKSWYIYMLDLASFTDYYLSQVEQWMESVRWSKKMYFKFRIVDICIFYVHKILYFKYICSYFFTDVKRGKWRYYVHIKFIWRLKDIRVRCVIDLLFFLALPHSRPQSSSLLRATKRRVLGREWLYRRPNGTRGKKVRREEWREGGFFRRTL